MHVTNTIDKAQEKRKKKKKEKYLIEVYLNWHLIHFVIVQHLLAILGLASRERMKEIVFHASYNWNEYKLY